MSKDEEIFELTAQNELLENYFRNTIIPQIFVDANFILRKFTPPALKQLHLSANDVGRNLKEIKDNSRFPSILENIQWVIDTQQSLEKEIQTTDLKWYQMNILPYITLADNKTNGVIITFIDITARIQDLKEQEKLIADHESLLDTISHDLKTPLTSLRLGIDLLKNTPIEDTTEFRSLLNLADNSLGNLQRLISSLADNRKESYRYAGEEELLNFEHILEDVRLTVADSLIKTGGVIHSDIRVSEINFSRRKLRSVVYNLITNAIKFYDPARKPEIWVKTDMEKNFVVISIRDNGKGIEKDKHESIFSKYYRTVNEVEGSGIGLYLVREIVTNSGGKISVASTPGNGAEFKVYISA